ncbi:MAG: hypothetical protein P8I94_04335, partial [Emcibacteraceae bacterium]|nr:hypothetical protein [Emcibacteraceae bacterium]
DDKALYRGILLPFSDNGEDINFVLAGVRWILEKEAADNADQPSVEDLMSMITAGRDDGYDDAPEEEPLIEPEIAPIEEEIEEEAPSEDETRLTLPDSQEAKFDALGKQLNSDAADEPVEAPIETNEEIAPEEASPIDDVSIPEPADEEPISTNEQALQSDLKKELKIITKFIKKEDGHHNRSRDSLYNILTAIYDFYHKCDASSEEYLELVSKHDLKVQERAPFTPVLKMCLGKKYDKTRLTEYAAALNIAKHLGISIDDFHDFIKDFPGGIKGCVKEMRAVRKGTTTLDAVNPSKSAEEARNILREMPPIGQLQLKKVITSQKTDEFCLMVGKRDGNKIDVIKLLDDSHDKLDPILKRTAFLKGNLKK